MANQQVNLIVGAGKLGQRFYRYLQSLEQTAITLSKKPKTWSQHHITYDLLQNEAPLPQLPALNTVFILLAPVERTESAYRQTYITAVTRLLTQLHRQHTAFHCVFVSSTAVFSANTETIISEQTPPQADSFSGKILLEAEQTITSLHPNTSILRAAGLYSSKRQTLLNSLLDAAQYDNPKWLNLIHEDDVCYWLWQTAIHRWPITIAADGFPFQRRHIQDFKHSIATEELPLPAPFKASKRYLSQHREQMSLHYPSVFHWLQNKM